MFENLADCTERGQQLVEGMLNKGLINRLLQIRMTYSPEAPFLTFGSPGMAAYLDEMGPTVLASNSTTPYSFQGSWGDSVKIKFADLADPKAFDEEEFGFVHIRRWGRRGKGDVANAVRWLKPGGVLLVESPDCYPVDVLPRGPYQAVASAFMDRVGMPQSLTLPMRLMAAGLTFVGCEHRTPEFGAARDFLEHRLEQDVWPDLLAEDLAGWRKDAEATRPYVMNVVAWGWKFHAEEETNRASG